MGTVRQERVLKGLCPNCGKEAAPYLICYDCRFKMRLHRCLKRGRKIGVLAGIGSGRNTLWRLGNNDTNEGMREWEKWQTPMVLPETDRRGHARMRGIRVDVERTLIEVIKH